MNCTDGIPSPDRKQATSPPSQASPAAENRPSADPSVLIHEVISLTPAKTTVSEAFGNQNLPDRLAEYFKRVTSGRAFGDYLAEIDEDRSRKLKDCGSWLTFRDYYTLPERRLRLASAHFCQQPLLCEMCASRRAVKNLQVNVPKFLALLDRSKHLRPYMLTITSKDRTNLRAMRVEQLTAWSRWLKLRSNALKPSVRRRKACALAHLEGGVMSFETKRGTGSGLWHFHGHAIVLGSPGLTKHAFYPEWSDLLGYDANLDLRPLQSAKLLDAGCPIEGMREPMATDLLEVFKYALKFSTMESEDRWSAFNVMRGVHLVRAFGSCRGIKDVDAYTDELPSVDGLPFWEVVYKYVTGGYLRTRLLHSDENGEPTVPRHEAFDRWNAAAPDTLTAAIVDSEASSQCHFDSQDDF